MGGSAGSSASGGSAGGSGGGGQAGGSGGAGALNCDAPTCGGDLVGNWRYTDVCWSPGGGGTGGQACQSVSTITNETVSGTITFNADATWQSDNKWVVDSTNNTPAACSNASMCADDARLLGGTCVFDASTGCACVIKATRGTPEHGTYIVNGSSVTLSAIFTTATTMATDNFCVSGQTMRMQMTAPIAGPVFILMKQ